MKKTLIASAVAAATLSTGAFAETAPVSIYGDIEIFGSYTDMDGASDPNDGITDDVDSTIGFSHSTAISDETTVSATAEFIYNSTISGSGLGVDQAFITFAGGFGSVSLGTIDSVYEDLDIIDFSENLGGLSAGDMVGNGDSQNINYVSPKIADSITLKATVATDEDAADIGQIVVAYEMDNIAVNFGYGMNDEDLGGEDVIGLSGSIGLDELTVTAQYETKDEVGDFYGLLGTYAMGANTFNLAYMNFAADGGEDVSSISANAVHNLSDNVYVYVEAIFQSSDDDTQEMDQYVIGTAYSF